MKKLTQIVLMTIAFGLLIFSADSAMAQGRGKYRQEARREHRQDVRKARREYREDIRDARRDRYRNNDRYNRVGPRGRANGYYNRRPNVGNRNRYVYRNNRVYRRW